MKPVTLMMKHASNLFADEAERGRFVEALTEGVGRESAILILKDRPEIKVFPHLPALPWQPNWVMRIDPEFRAAKHALYEKGAYYSLDFSSVFSASAMLAIPNPVRRVLDLCASPGGKAIFAWRAFNPEVLACNEAIRKRTGALISNLHRCGIERSVVWSADPSVYARKFPKAFDLLIVDAPCSGQSLLAKGDEAPGCWHPEMIEMNVGRQRRIIGNAAQCVRPGGHLLYATCTFSVKENEKVAAWLMQQMPDFEAVPVPHLEAFRSPHADFPCYRLFPHQGFGAGAFTCLLRRNGEPEEHWPSIEEFRGFWRFGNAAPVRDEVEPVVPERFSAPEDRPKHYPRRKPVKPMRKKPEPGGRRNRRRR